MTRRGLQQVLDPEHGLHHCLQVLDGRSSRGSSSRSRRRRSSRCRLLARSRMLRRRRGGLRRAVGGGGRVRRRRRGGVVSGCGVMSARGVVSRGGLLLLIIIVVSTAVGAGAIRELPSDREFTNARRIEMREETFTHIKGTVVASWALVHDRCTRTLSTGMDSNRLEALGTWRSTAVLRCIQGDNKVTGDVDLAASTQANIKVRSLTAERAFFNALCNVSMVRLRARMRQRGGRTEQSGDDGCDGLHRVKSRVKADKGKVGSSEGESL